MRVPTVAAVKFKHERTQYYLVDIREADEIESNPVPKNTVVIDEAMPMGKIFSLLAGCVTDTEEGSSSLDAWKDKKIVLLCGTGYRSAITATHLNSFGFDAAALSRGIAGLQSPAATVPDFVVVLGEKFSAEKLTLALNAAAVAASNGETTVLALMGDGVCTFLRKGSNKDVDTAQQSFRVEETFIGEPFKPCHTLLTKFLGTGNGVVLACISCVKSRKIEFGSDLLDCVESMQMPDLLRMLGEAKKNLQFL